VDERTHADFDLNLRNSAIYVSFAFYVRYNRDYPLIRTLFAHEPDRRGGQPVATWLSAELDTIVYDFMEQLRGATESGWHRTKPCHYRAILAALESALKERHVLAATPASALENQTVLDRALPRRARERMPAALRRSLSPLLAFVPSRSH
jgi:hypothetical protein